MAEGWFQVALSNSQIFSNTASNDLIIRTGTAAQRVLIGPTVTPSITAPLMVNQSGVSIRNLGVTGSIIPSANEAFDLGSSTLRFRDLFLSGSTINLGGAQISTDQLGAIIMTGLSNLPLRLIVKEIQVSDTATSSNAVFISTNPTTGDIQIVKGPAVPSAPTVGSSNVDSNVAAAVITDTFVRNIYNLNNFIGIGTSNPVEALDVSGTVRATTGYKVNNTVIFDASGILASTTAIAAGAITSSQLAYTLNLGNITTSGNLIQNGTEPVVSFNPAIDSTTGRLAFCPSGTTNNITTATELVWESGTQGLGIGILNPSGSLHASGVINAEGGFATASTTMVSNLTAQNLGASGQDDAFFRDATNLNAGTLPVVRGGTGTAALAANKLLVADSNGLTVVTPSNLHWDGASLGVGTANPSGTLHVVGNIYFSGNLLQNGAPFIGGSTLSGLRTNCVTVASGSSNIYTASNMFWDNTNNRLGIATSTPSAPLHVSGSNSGGISILADADISAFSDGRLKTNLAIIPDALDKVGRVHGYTYDRIQGGKRAAGVIAQEVMEVLPEVVSQADDGYYSVAYGNISALLINAINELKERVERLEAAAV